MAYGSVDATGRKMPRKSSPNQLSFDLAPPLPREIKLMSVDEIYTHLESITPVDAKEDRRIERKPAGVTARALGDYDGFRDRGCGKMVYPGGCA